MSKLDFYNKQIQVFMCLFGDELEGCRAKWHDYFFNLVVIEIHEGSRFLVLPPAQCLKVIYATIRPHVETELLDADMPNFAFTATIWTYRLTALYMKLYTERFTHEHYLLHATRVDLTTRSAGYCMNFPN